MRSDIDKSRWHWPPLLRAAKRNAFDRSQSNLYLDLFVVCDSLCSSRPLAKYHSATRSKILPRPSGESLLCQWWRIFDRPLFGSIRSLCHGNLDMCCVRRASTGTSPFSVCSPCGGLEMALSGDLVAIYCNARPLLFLFTRDVHTHHPPPPCSTTSQAYGL